MTRFWLLLWAYWAFYLTLFSLLLALLLAASATAATYLYKGAPVYDEAVAQALMQVGGFWFAPAWGIALPVGTLFGLRALFNRCFAGYSLRFFGCDREERSGRVGLEELLRVWRKWLMATVWVVAVEILAAVGCVVLFGSETTPMGWFSVEWLYLFILLSGCVTLPMMGGRCKQAGVRPC